MPQLREAKQASDRPSLLGDTEAQKPEKATKPDERATPRVADFTFGPTAVLTPANLITFARVAALPLVIYLILTAQGPNRWWTLGLWIVVMMSDLLDGFLARKQGTTTSGAYLDPLADKFAVLGSLAALAWVGRVSWIPLAIITLRELAVSLFRSYASRRSVTVPATPFGKAKTLSQSIAIGVLLLPVIDDVPVVGQVAIWVAVGFTVASGLDYLRRGSTYLASEVRTDQPPVDHGTIEQAIKKGREGKAGQQKLDATAEDQPPEPRMSLVSTDQGELETQSQPHRPTT